MAQATDEQIKRDWKPGDRFEWTKSQFTVSFVNYATNHVMDTERSWHPFDRIRPLQSEYVQSTALSQSLDAAKETDLLRRIRSSLQTELERGVITDTLWMNDDAETIFDALEAALSLGQAGVGVAVKPLEWTGNPRDTLVRADTIVGIYRVWTHYEANGEWFWALENFERAGGTVASEETGIAAAQADYEARIRSALVPSPQGEGLVEAPEDGWEQSADAMVWAKAYLYHVQKNNLSFADAVDPGYMVGWFANYWAAITRDRLPASALARAGEEDEISTYEFLASEFDRLAILRKMWSAQEVAATIRRYEIPTTEAASPTPPAGREG